MLASVFGNETAEKVLFYLVAHGQGYAREIAKTFGVSVSMIQKQLLRFERGGVIVGHLVGRTHVFALNPAYALAKEVRALLQSAMTFLPAKDRTPYAPKRMRPRATGKRL